MLYSMSDTTTARADLLIASAWKKVKVSDIQQLRPLFATPQGRLRLVHKGGRPDWFDGREVRVAAGKDATGSRAIVLSVSGPAGEYHLPLGAGEAAQLMFEIGYALEQATQEARSH